MSKPRLTETQIVALLKEAESGVPVPRSQSYADDITLARVVFISGGQNTAAWKPLTCGD